MWLAEGKSSLPEEGRTAKSKLGMRFFFQEQQGGILFTEELTRSKVVGMAQREAVGGGSSHQILLGSTAWGSQMA